jgi:hypothetical protein
MNNFLKKIIIFLVLFIFLLSVIFIINNDGYMINIKDLNKNKIAKKLEFFEEFTNHKNNINIVLGSSLARDSIIPDSLGEDWFSFTNGAQSIQNSYDFLNFYKNLIKFKKVIIVLNPFDFVNPSEMDKNYKLPIQNSDFYIFTKSKKLFQTIKNNNFPNLKFITKLFSKEKNMKKIGINWTKQGYTGNLKKGSDIGFYYKNKKEKDKNVHRYFRNMTNDPYMKSFDLFNDLSDFLEIDVTYLITPKSEHYLSSLSEHKYDNNWKNILDSLKKRKVEIWDFETMKTDTFKFHWYVDETHSSHDGAKAFTKIIRKRLKD